jgi:hypothetical protein
MSGTHTIIYVCPFCQCTHKREIDNTVFYAEIRLFCDDSEGGCKSRVKLKYWGDGNVQVFPIEACDRHKSMTPNAPRLF